jgi:hypothetical protein
VTTFAGQYGPAPIIDPNGAPLKGLAVSVFLVGTTTPTSLYTDRTKAVTAPNPAISDSAGNFGFYAAPGQYDLVGNGARVTVSCPVDPASALGSIVAGAGITLDTSVPNETVIDNAGVTSLAVNGGSPGHGDLTLSALPLAGGTVTGPIVLAADPSANLQAATKQYVDNNVGLSSALPLTGGTMSGPIAMGSSKITGLANGVSPQDAATVSQLSSSAGAATSVTGPDIPGASSVVGTSAAYARQDHDHGLPNAGAAGASAIADTASAGSATTIARSDHKHSREAFSATTPAALGSAAVGTDAGFPHADHVHPTTGLLLPNSDISISSGT